MNNWDCRKMTFGLVGSPEESSGLEDVVHMIPNLGPVVHRRQDDRRRWRFPGLAIVSVESKNRCFKLTFTSLIEA